MESLYLLVLLLSFSFTKPAKILDATKFTEELRKLADDVLGVKKMQDHFHSLDFDNYNLDGGQLIESLGQSLREKFEGSVQSVRSLQDAVQDSYSGSAADFTECCNLNSEDLVYDKRFGKEIDVDTACVRVAPLARGSTQIPASVLDVMKSNYEENPAIKWQYFGSEEGIFTIYPASARANCDDYENRYRPWYVETATSQPKNIVLVIDKSESMNVEYGGRTLLAIAKEAANTVIDTMNPNDKVNVVAFSDDVETPSDCEDDCYKRQLAQATPQNKDCLKDFVNSIRSGGDTRYNDALDAAFNLLNFTGSVTDGVERAPVILFLTDGQPTDMIDDNGLSEEIQELKRKYNILLTIKERNAEMGNRLVMLTFGLGNQVDDTLLTNMAIQDGTSYGIAKIQGQEVKIGRYRRVSDPTNLRQEMASYYNIFAEFSDTPVFSVPYQAASGIGLVATVALPVVIGSQLKGVVGVDISLQDLFSDITFFREGQSTYSFIYEINQRSNGRTLNHPLLPAPTTIEQDPVFVHITSLERESDFLEKIYEPSKQDGVNQGSDTFHSTRTIPRGNSATEGVRILSVESTYYWRKVADTPYVVCLVMEVNDVQTRLPQQTPTGTNFVYHRLDLTDNPGRCRHFTRKASKDYSSVKLAPEAFEDPIRYLYEEDDANKVELYTQYMNGENNVNTYFKEGVRDMVVATSEVESLWVSLADTTDADLKEAREHIAFLYIGTDNGVFRIYPAVEMDKIYDHTVRPWYERAKSNKGNITLSAPYRAVSGAGYVITLSHTVTERNIAASSSGTSDEVIGVIGMDITLHYLSFLLKNLYTQCNDERYSCFVMDSSGYLIYHDSFFNLDNGEIDLDKPHITEVDELRSIAQHLITKGILVKYQCVDFQKIKLQNYYKVYDVPNGVENLADNDACKQYEMERIGASNAYLGIIDQRDRCFQPALCPCTQKCQKADMDDKCECPCESPVEYNYCKDKYEFTSDDVPSCTPPIIDPSPVTDERGSLRSLPQCLATDCGRQDNALDCNAAISCEWCYDGLYENVLVGTPFCGDIIYKCQPPKSSGTSSGVIAAVIVVIIIIIAVAIVATIWFVRRKKAKSMAKGEHYPVTFTANTEPSAPPPPTAPSVRPPPIAPTTVDYDVPPYHDEHDEGPGGYIPASAPTQLTDSRRSDHYYETPQDFEHPDYQEYPST